MNSVAKKDKAADEQPASHKETEKKQKKMFSQRIFSDWCKSCGLCVAFCPQKVIGLDESGAPVIEKPDDCIGCRFCELHCPDFAITIKERGNNTRRGAS